MVEPDVEFHISLPLETLQQHGKVQVSNLCHGLKQFYKNKILGHIPGKCVDENKHEPV